MMKAKYEEAVELRRKAEMDIENFRPVRLAVLGLMIKMNAVDISTTMEWLTFNRVHTGC